MPSLNNVLLIGHLGRDPEVRFTPSGTAVCNFSLATSEKWKGGDGETQERTDWHKVTVWGKQGENCGQYLAKGRLVCVTGSIHYDSYTDDEGNKKWATKIIARRVLFLGGKVGGESEPQQSAEVSDDDVPF